MKSVDTATVDTITNDHTNVVGSIVRAEWQLNKFYRTVVDNTPSEDTDGYDIEFFPITSITKPNRPKAGIVKAVVGQALVDSKYHDTVPAARYYTVSADDEYKYWQSPESAGATPFVIANCAPQVTYVAEDDVSGSPVPIQVRANKITFTVENTYANPVNHLVQVKYTTGGAWVTVSTNPAVPTGGKVELWYNGTGWTTTPVYTSTVMVSAVRLVVTKMDKQAFFNLIELGLCLERDLSADVVSFNDSFNMGEPDFLTPLGNISSNTGSVTLFNDSGAYTNANSASIFGGLLDKGVIFRAYFTYGSDIVQEFEMFSDEWNEDIDQTTVSLVDGSKFFMDTKPRPVMYKSIPVQEAVWRICDIIGFNNYNITAIDLSPHSIIDIFWTDGQKTAWEIFTELSKATQTAIYFDSFGVLQVKTRDAAWNSAAAPVYTFIKDSIAGGQPSNIVNLKDETQYEANKVTINWKPTAFSERIDNIIPFEVVWEPDSSVVLRSTELASNLLIADTVIHLPLKEGKTWPWSGMMQVEGEWIEFEGKSYVYYDSSNVRQSTWVNDYESQKRIDEDTNASYRHLNHYTGNLKVKTRGLFNTDPANHYIDMTGWFKSRQRNYGTVNSPCSGISLNKGESSVTVSGPSNSDMDDYTYLHRGNAIDQGYYYVGTRLKVDKTAHRDKVGGIFFNGDGGLGSGYYVEVMATSRMNGKMRHTRNELIFYSMKPDGTKKILGGDKVIMKDKSKNHQQGATIKHDVGAELAVVADRYVDIDVWYTPGTDDKVQIWANGSLLFETTITNASGWKHSRVSRAGMYARGHSSLTFDYFYGINNLGVDAIDGESYYDRIDGAYRGNQMQKDWIYEVRKVRRKVRNKWTKVAQKYNQRLFEDFGPMAHEIREFKVKFTSDTPVLESKLYFSNTTQVVCTEYVGDISGAHFIMANIDRRDAIVSGDDDVTSQGNGTINHKLFVYGRPVIQKDSQQIVKTDEWAIRRRGIIDVEYDSNWIQNETEANNFADWLTTHWTRSDSEVNAEVFGNPLIELTDVIHVNYNDIDSDYYVVGVNNAFDNGITTQLTLRKVS